MTRRTMSRLYRHRVNTLEALQQTPAEQGIELDLRSDGDRVIVTHDPFTDGPALDEYLAQVGRRPCIFNVKCEGIEALVLDRARHHGIEDFFFLDLSIPAAVKLWRQGETRLAVRWSEYEPLAGVMAWAGRARWVWVDCFTAFPGSAADWTTVAREFQLCLVSPELQGRGAETIAETRRSLAGRHFDAACSKRPDLWSEGAGG